MIFFDEDCNARFHGVEAGTMTGDDLDGLVDHLKDTGVKYFIVGVNGLGACFPSRIMQPVLEGFDMKKGLFQEEGKIEAWPYRFRANMTVLQEQGIDSNQYLLDRAREKGLAPMVTIRMNDQHGNENAKGPWPLRWKLWTDRPDLRISRMYPPGAFDYAKEEVRRTFLAFVLETMEFYDADGYVIDWMRHLPYFDDGTGETHAPLLTEMMTKIREGARKLEDRRRHSIQIIARIPSDIQRALYYGMDGVEWANRKLVDRLVPSPKYIRDYTIDAASWRNAIHDKNFPVTICIEHAYQPYPGYPRNAAQGVWTFDPPTVKRIPFVRGAAWNAFHRGSDGIYLFNFMWMRNNPEFRAIFEDCRSVDALRGKERAYEITYNDLDMSDDDFFSGWRAGGSDTYFGKWRGGLQKQGKYPYQLPRFLHPGTSEKFHIFTGPVSDGKMLKLYFDKVPESMKVTLNGIPCVFRQGGWEAPVSAIPGNEANIEVFNPEEQTCEIERVFLSVPGFVEQ
ncbi:MAG: hypothetical protein BWY31_01645 [Lentisphaerae bacterium ADurb.Bin242]|nr:MAG: hypothetical protein BWY31_01645 [Lentisphaerae bacterium ADurb.Bin242]